MTKKIKAMLLHTGQQCLVCGFHSPSSCHCCAVRSGFHTGHGKRCAIKCNHFHCLCTARVVYYNASSTCQSSKYLNIPLCSWIFLTCTHIMKSKDVFLLGIILKVFQNSIKIVIIITTKHVQF